MRVARPANKTGEASCVCAESSLLLRVLGSFVIRPILSFDCRLHEPAGESQLVLGMGRCAGNRV